MLEELRKKVLDGNLALPDNNLVKFTWGNVSAVDRKKKLFVIKPSGVNYEILKPEMLVVCNFDGNVIEGDLNPSSDMPTHAYLYRKFEEIGSIVHTHQTWTTAWAQAGIDIPVTGTTHADTFYGNIPCTRYLTPDEVIENYEKNTAKVIVETFEEKNINPLDIPAVILNGHGPFIWGRTVSDAIENSISLEEISKINYLAKTLNKDKESLPEYILDKHYLRKHGKNAYYGQKGGKNG